MSLLIVISLLLSSLTVTVDDDTRVDTLDEVVVVAQRTTAVSKSPSQQVAKIFLDRLESEQRTAVKDLSAVIPNLYIPDYGSKMTSTIYVRGLGARIDNPVMGLYLDGVGIANKNNYDFQFDDIAKVEVFRGPQGTLFGKNTMGGLISVETLNPFIFEGTRGTVGYGNANTLNLRVAHYELINDDLGISCSLSGNHTDGFFRNAFDGSKADNVDDISARLRIDYRRSRMKLTNSLTYSYLQQNGFPYHLDQQPVNHNDPCNYFRHALIEALTYSCSFDKYTVSGSTSYQFLGDKMTLDQDYLPLSYFTMHQAQMEHYVSQEILFKPNEDMFGFWNWLTGFSFNYKLNDMDAPVNFKKDGIDEMILKNANQGIRTVFPNDSLLFEENEFTIASDFRQQNLNLALFHTSFFKVEDWRFEAGLRLNYEYLRMDYNSEAAIHYLFTGTMSDYKLLNTTLQNVSRLAYFEVLPRVSVAYQGEGWSAYLSCSEGYKGGGFNTQLFADIIRNLMMKNLMEDLGVYLGDNASLDPNDVITYKPENCVNTEIGAKLNRTFGDWRLDGGIDLFWMEVFNQQLTVFPEGTTGRMMTNAGRSRSLGAELSVNVAWNGLDFNLSYGYTNARFVKYNDGKADYAGKYLPYVPENTVAAGIGYRINLKHKFFYSLYLNVNTNAYGRIYWNESNTLSQPLYALLNANISLNTKYFNFEIWGKNLTNTDYNVFYFVSSGNEFYQTGKPVSYGAKLTFFI